MRKPSAGLGSVASRATAVKGQFVTEEYAERRHGDARPLSELAATWVAQNPTPLELAPPDYDR